MDYKKLLSIIDKIVIERAKSNGLEKKDLDMYYVPLNIHHKKHLADSFGIKHSLLNDEKNLYFARFIASLFNSSYTNYMSRIERKRAISKVLNNFNFEEFVYNKKSLLEKIQSDDVLNQISSDRIKNSISQSICDIHQFIETHFDKITEYSKTNASSINEYIKIVEEILKLNSNKTDKIHGLGIALYSDALKETGIIDLVKPDVHILDFYAKIKGINSKKINIDQALILDLSQFFYEFSRATNESIYKLDKKIWLISSKNPFYLSEKKDYKEKLLNAISMTI